MYVCYVLHGNETGGWQQIRVLQLLTSISVIRVVELAKYSLFKNIEKIRKKCRTVL